MVFSEGRKWSGGGPSAKLKFLQTLLSPRMSAIEANVQFTNKTLVTSKRHLEKRFSRLFYLNFTSDSQIILSLSVENIYLYIRNSFTNWIYSVKILLSLRFRQQPRWWTYSLLLKRPSCTAPYEFRWNTVYQIYIFEFHHIPNEIGWWLALKYTSKKSKRCAQRDRHKVRVTPYTYHL